MQRQAIKPTKSNLLMFLNDEYINEVQIIKTADSMLGYYSNFVRNIGLEKFEDANPDLYVSEVECEIGIIKLIYARIVSKTTDSSILGIDSDERDLIIRCYLNLINNGVYKLSQLKNFITEISDSKFLLELCRASSKYEKWERIQKLSRSSHLLN